MKIWKSISNTISNVLGLVDDLVGEQGLRTTQATSFAIVNESLEQSLIMNRITSKLELDETLQECNASIDAEGVITYGKPEKVKK